MIDNKKMKLTLVDLPTRVETFKTIDRVNYFKSADIGQVAHACYVCSTACIIVWLIDSPVWLVQMLLVEPETTVSDELYASNYQLYSGIMPCTKDLPKRWNKRRPKVCNQRSRFNYGQQFYDSDSVISCISTYTRIQTHTRTRTHTHSLSLCSG
jgi:TATA-binding protein-associated factor Taf7